MSRQVKNVIKGKDVPEGKGAIVCRTIGTSNLKNLDPFLMLDEFRATPPAGFPDHPHRGFETVTYMLEGTMQHEDFLGNKGVINAGDLQWMTAGRGIVHSEMPVDPKCNHGLQLWINLARKDKMVEPTYQDLSHEHVPEAIQDGVKVKVIAGQSIGSKSQVRTRTPAMYLDFTVEANSSFSQPIKEGWTTFAYVLQGKIHFGPESHQTIGEPKNLLIFDDGSTVDFLNKDSETCRFVLISGEPIKEPIVQYGPFVMTNHEEIDETFEDYKNAKNGFEGAQEWLAKRNL